MDQNDNVLIIPSDTLVLVLLILSVIRSPSSGHFNLYACLVPADEYFELQQEGVVKKEEQRNRFFMRGEER